MNRFTILKYLLPELQSLNCLLLIENLNSEARVNYNIVTNFYLIEKICDDFSAYAAKICQRLFSFDLKDLCRYSETQRNRPRAAKPSYINKIEARADSDYG